MTTMSNQSYLEAALRTADWMERNQVNNVGDDANTGRFLAYYYPGRDTPPQYSHNWTTGVCIFGQLAAYHRTGEKKYLDAALRGGSYLKSLQILDERRRDFFGALKEVTPFSYFCYPRDALTGAWAMAWLYEETKDLEWKYRARIFSDWFLEIAMQRGWPAWDFRFEHPEDVGFEIDYSEGNFHGGSAGFFYDYARITHDTTRLDRGVRFIADHLLMRFLGADGKFKVLYDPALGKYRDDDDTAHSMVGYKRMHMFNDDFACIGLLGAYCYYGDPIYLERAEAHARWLMSEQREDGGFGTPAVPVASATAPILLLDLFKLTGKTEYHDAAHRAGQHLMTMQYVNEDDPKGSGGFFGLDDAKYDGNDVRQVLNIRDGGYALLALLKLEGKVSVPYYSVFDRDGDVGLRRG
ncbi:hypothetical protein CVU37_10425 [candidate division BRC1 bacterium HGW-BRC1-1]|jgi:uncharacterized protein YyaL (SSP411 family)|nr:MAG: hypothetical protein CVU37_10425 [candidate division BRC1 bacterium HGW-BRC1-1]